MAGVNRSVKISGVYTVPAEADPRIGTGNWEAFGSYPIEHVLKAAEKWRAFVMGEKKLRLCWNVIPQWSVRAADWQNQPDGLRWSGLTLAPVRLL